MTKNDREEGFPKCAQNLIRAARDYCAWVEETDHSVRDARQHLLATLAPVPDVVDYLKGLDLPFDEYDIEKRPNTYDQVRKLLGDFPLGYYADVWQPLEFEKANKKNPTLGDAIDDLADIYGDLIEGLTVGEKHGLLAGVDELVLTYRIHWGRHAVSALRAVDEYYRIQSEENLRS